MPIEASFRVMTIKKCTKEIRLPSQAILDPLFQYAFNGGSSSQDQSFI